MQFIKDIRENQKEWKYGYKEKMALVYICSLYHYSNVIVAPFKINDWNQEVLGGRMVKKVKTAATTSQWLLQLYNGSPTSVLHHTCDRMWLKEVKDLTL